EALGWTRRALSAGENAEVIRAALPDLERLAKAQALAGATRFAPNQRALPPGLLAGLVDLLDTDPDGQSLLEAASRGAQEAVRQSLALLAGRADVPPELAHHLALIHHRAALALEGGGQPEAAEAFWPLAWRCWLRFLAQEDDRGRRLLVLKRLLEIHRRR